MDAHPITAQQIGLLSSAKLIVVPFLVLHHLEPDLHFFLLDKVPPLLALGKGRRSEVPYRKVGVSKDGLRLQRTWDARARCIARRAQDADSASEQ